MKSIFPSLAHPTKYGYLFDTDSWSPNAQVDPYFRMFETYNDGLTQHSGDWTIAIEFITDYLFSLTAAMLEDEKLAEAILFPISRRPSVEDIEFAASIVWKESDGLFNKRRYYSVKERKITSSHKKEYDKRYFEVQSWNDGSVTSIYRILVPEHGTGLDRYCYAEGIYNWASRQPKVYMNYPAQFLKWFNEDGDKARALYSAFNACKNVADAHRLKSAAQSSIEAYRQSLLLTAEATS